LKNRKFTVVTLLKNEVKRLERSLPLFYKINPDEVIICTDDPSPPKVLNAINKIAKQYGMENRTKIVAVRRNPEFGYHQAWVRRSGFTASRNDIILTSDIDLLINKNVLKAIDLVGKNNVGLVSLSKFRHPYNLISFYRAFGAAFIIFMYYLLLRHIGSGTSGVKMTTFTGLYALHRPSWLDSEDDGVKKIHSPSTKKNPNEKNNSATFRIGEDTYLRDCMVKKYNIIYLSRIGAVIMDREKIYHPSQQIERAIYSIKTKRSLIGAIIHSIIWAEPHYLKKYLEERKIQRGRLIEH